MTDKQWVDMYVSKEMNLPHSSMYDNIKGNVRDIITMLQKLVDKVEASGYRNLKIEWGHIEGTPCYDVMAERLETDEEFQRRRDREDQEEAKERALYEKLKQKFEPEYQAKIKNVA